MQLPGVNLHRPPDPKWQNPHRARHSNSNRNHQSYWVQTGSHAECVHEMSQEVIKAASKQASQLLIFAW